MIDTALAFVTTIPLPAFTAIGAGLAGLWFGWMFKGANGRRTEKELKQAVLDAKGAIPKFESSVRSREQDIGRLQLEIDSLRTRSKELDQAIAEKDQVLRTQTRDIRVLTTELAVAKNVPGTEGVLLDGMDFDGNASGQSDETLQARVIKAEALYNELRETLVQREDKIETLEAQLAGPVGPHKVNNVPTEALDNGRLRVLEDQISGYKVTIERLEHQLSETRQDRDLLSGLISSRQKEQPIAETSSSELAAQIAELEQVVELKEQVVQNRDETMRRLLSELEQLNDDRKDQQAETAKLISEIQSREAEYAELEAQVDLLLKELDALRPLEKQHEKLAEQLRDAEASLEQSESWLEKFKIAAANRSEELGCVTAERDQLRAQLTSD